MHKSVKKEFFSRRHFTQNSGRSNAGYNATIHGKSMGKAMLALLIFLRYNATIHGKSRDLFSPKKEVPQKHGKGTDLLSSKKKSQGYEERQELTSHKRDPVTM